MPKDIPVFVEKLLPPQSLVAEFGENAVDDFKEVYGRFPSSRGEMMQFAPVRKEKKYQHAMTKGERSSVKSERDFLGRMVEKDSK